MHIDSCASMAASEPSEELGPHHVTNRRTLSIVVPTYTVVRLALRRSPSESRAFRAVCARRGTQSKDLSSISQTAKRSPGRSSSKMPLSSILGTGASSFLGISTSLGLVAIRKTCI